ncbi:predicted protein [Naegleria gruberi]|uniref:Predicted protein n=1 Tax=Naegleria gruberi TaxID=5762 RepID=D2V8N4_NAEGR|nr:uncharacterized protein NAEGRDRAFT_65219 [Naegleria gruberi]EFC46721.1 predicted protein [Naegleria gruberi]|eukprot:XP_002679465.1 predicted protein [Naegleria gruberi strain NEG-M]
MLGNNNPSSINYLENNLSATRQFSKSNNLKSTTSPSSDAADDSYFNISVQINQDGILFKEYPFALSSVGRGNSIVPFQAIREFILDDSNHAEIRTHNNEILFMRCDFNIEDLKKTNIPIYTRQSIDLWSDITEPFLDSSVPQVEEKVEQLISRYSISREECEKLYSIISEPVFAYNFETMLWEYVSLDLVDVLSSLDKNCPLSQKPLSEEKFKEFYNYANNFTLKYENRNDFTKYTE